jgi:hypothetical protein
MVIVVLPFGAGFPFTDDPYPHFRAVPWLDLAFLGLIIAVGPYLWRSIRERDMGIGAVLWSVVLLVLAASFVAHPSLIGVQTLLRLVGVLGIAVAFASLGDPERSLIVGVAGLVALFEVAVALLQLAAGGPLGIIGEVPDPLLARATVLLPRGTLSHGYVLTGLAAVIGLLVAERALGARRPAPWLALASVVVVPIGLSCSRAALAGYAAACAVFVPAARSPGRARILFLALLIGAGVPLLVQRDGWIVRVEEGIDLHNRTRLIDQATVLLGENALLGVGPGNYVAAARARFPDASYTQAVHDVPLLVAVEGGVIAGAACVVLVAALGWRALRRGPADLALFLAFAPFVVVDVFPYVFVQGTVLLGLWIGGLDRAAATAAPLQWRTRSVRPVREERRIASASSSVRSASSPVTTVARRP